MQFGKSLFHGFTSEIFQHFPAIFVSEISCFDFTTFSLLLSRFFVKRVQHIAHNSVTYVDGCGNDNGDCSDDGDDGDDDVDGAGEGAGHRGAGLQSD